MVIPSADPSTMPYIRLANVIFSSFVFRLRWVVIKEGSYS